MPRRTARSRRVRPARGALTAAAVGLIAATSFVLPASATDDLTINPDEVVRADPGSVVTVAEQPVPAELVGRTCDLRIVTENGSSVHPGNVVVTSTGDARIETPGVEEDSQGKVVALEPVALGDTIVVQLQLGPDGLSSLGFTVAVDCPDLTEESPPVLPALQERPPLQTAPPASPSSGNPTFTG